MGNAPQPDGLASSIPLRALVAVVVALAAMGAVLAAQALLRPPSAAPARLGAAVKVPGGVLRVEQVIPERMAPMQMDKFEQSGMRMSGTGMDMTPEGYRRFTVQFTLASQENGGLRYSASHFRVAGQGMQETGPLHDPVGDGFVPAGSAVSGSLIFQVPEGASELLLHFRDGDRPIALELDPTTHSHDQGEGEGDDHQHQ